MPHQIIIKRSSVPDKVPTTEDLDLGEFGINTFSGKVYIKRNYYGNEQIVDVTANQPITIASDDIAGTSETLSTGASTIHAALTPTGVTPGTYTKLTVDAKGRVSAGYQLEEADLPAQISWTRISSKPSTIAGYGITDAQPADPDLDAIANVSGFGYLKKIGTNTWITVENATEPMPTTFTGDVTGYGFGTIELTLGTINGNPGTFGSSTQVPVVTVNGKGLVTSITPVSIDFPVTSVAGKTGAVKLDVTDVVGAAPLESPTLNNPTLSGIITINGTLDTSLIDTLSVGNGISANVFAVVGRSIENSSAGTFELDSFSALDYQACEYLITATNETGDTEVLKIQVLHDGTTAFYVEYARVSSAGELLQVDSVDLVDDSVIISYSQLEHLSINMVRTALKRPVVHVV